MHIAIIDDDPLVRTALGLLLHRTNEVDSLSGHDDERPVLELMRERRVDTVLLDIRLRRGNGLAAIPALRHAGPGTRIVAMTAFADASFAAHARNAGAEDFIAKSAPHADVVGTALGRPRRADLPWQTLTPRERSVADLVAGGFSNAEIASRLGLRPSSVRTCVSTVFAKLGVLNRAQLANAVAAHGPAPFTG